jgi:hypothetical protein
MWVTIALTPAPAWTQNPSQNSLQSQSQASAWPNQSRIGQFHIHSSNRFSDLDDIGFALKQLTGEIEAVVGEPLGNETIHIVVLSSAEEFVRYIHHYFPTAPTRRALFVKDRGPGIVFSYQHPEWFSDLRHECTHALLHQRHSRLPLWLDEGLAEYFESRTNTVARAPAMRGSRVTRANNDVPDLMRNRRATHRSDLRVEMMQLESIDQTSQMSEQHYRLARDWVEFAIESSDSSLLTIRGYIADCSRLENAGSLTARLDVAVPKWGTSAERWFAQRIVR